MNAMVQTLSTSLALVPRSMDEAMRVAEFMASADMLPDHFKKKAGNCLMVVIQAQTWNMNPIAVAQCTAIVRGRLCYEGKLVSAVLLSMGAIREELDYDFSGTGMNRKVVVTGILANGNKRTVDGTVAQWKTSNEQWTKDADQMLVYRGARHWARRWAPAAMLGVYTPDEMEDVTQGDSPVIVTQQPANDGRPMYPADQFAANIGKWGEAMASGKKNADGLIAMIETKGALTDEQKAAIHKLDPNHKAPESDVIEGEIVQ